MKTLLTTLLVTLSLAATGGPALAGNGKKVSVVTTLNVLASVTREIGGDQVSVTCLASPKQDPHTLVAKPTFKVAARNAQLFVELGLGLDTWASAVVDASGNPDIQEGQKGRVVASQGITTRELPATLSRAWGDIHPHGNPHVWLDPVNVKQLARNIAAGLVRVDPASQASYIDRLKTFETRIDSALYGRELVDEYGASKLERLSRRGELIDYLERKGTRAKLGGWLKKAEPLRGLKIVTYHKTWIYFTERFGLVIASEIEEKPGIPPSQTHLNDLIKRIKAEGIRVVFVDTIYPVKDGQYLVGRTSARLVLSPIDVGAVDGAGDYFGLIDSLLDRLLAAAR